MGEPVTVLVIFNILIQLVIECRRSRCTTIDIGVDGVHIERDVQHIPEETAPPVYDVSNRN